MEKQIQQQAVKQVNRQKETQTKKVKKKKEIKLKIPYLNEIVFAALNILLVILLLTVLNRLGKAAEEIKDLGTKSLKGSSEVVYEAVQGRITSNKEKIDTLEALFIDDDSLIDFVGEIDSLKNEGAVSSFTFASDRAMKDGQTGYDALPFTIELKGSKESINYGLQKINKLPYLIREVVVEARKVSEEEGGMIFSYGGFLYVDDKFGKN